MNKTKQAAVQELPTEMIEGIVNDSDNGPEHLKKESPEYPLAGKVSIEGVGHVEIKDLRAELVRRKESVYTLGELVVEVHGNDGTSHLAAARNFVRSKRPGAEILNAEYDSTLGLNGRCEHGSLLVRVTYQIGTLERADG